MFKYAMYECLQSPGNVSDVAKLCLEWRIVNCRILGLSILRLPELNNIQSSIINIQSSIENIQSTIIQSILTAETLA
jgi:hypothetical protein